MSRITCSLPWPLCNVGQRSISELFRKNRMLLEQHEFPVPTVYVSVRLFGVACPVPIVLKALDSLHAVSI